MPTATTNDQQKEGMTMTDFATTRRSLLAGAAALAGSASFPRFAFAQGAPIKIGTLTPLTG